MGTFDRVKDFFGMNPETLPAAGDEYYEDEYEAGDYDYAERRREERHDDRREAHRSERVSALYAEERRPSGYAHDELEERPRRYRIAAEREAEFAAGRTVAPVRGSVALQPEVEDYAEYDDGLVVTPETVLERPRGYADGKSLGENFREGRAVVLDLNLMATDDARRMIDFSAGLVFALDGKMSKVADRERCFFMQPQGMDLTEAEIRDAANQAFRR